MSGWFTPENKLVEVMVKQALAQHERGYLDPRDEGSAYDCTILVPRTYEVKYDKASAQTGNLYFEIQNTYQNKPSGLSITRADYWVYLIPNQNAIALFCPKLMLDFLHEQLAKTCHGVRLTSPHRGDNNSQGILAPIALIMRQSFVTTIPFRLEIPQELPQISGVVFRCPQCKQVKAIEVFHRGKCHQCLSPMSMENSVHV